MSEEPTTPDLVEARRFAAALDRRDFDAAVAMFAPGAVWTTSGFEGAFEGRQAIRGLFEDFTGPFEDYALVPDELRDLGSGVIFAVILQRGRPKGSSEFVELRHAAVAILRKGLIERFATDTDIDRARAAAERLAQERGVAMPEESTTRDLEELVRSFSEAFSRRDFDAIVALLSRDAVWDTSSSVGLIGSVEGREAIRGALEDWTGAYEDYKQVLEELRDLGNGVIFSAVVECGQLRGSSGSIERRIAAVGVWADGLAQRITSYTDIDEARAAAERLAEERG